jgi:hypothetical protein
VGVGAPLPPVAGGWQAPPQQPTALARPRLATEDLYLAGPWEAVPADPSLWGHAGTPLTHFTVKAATLRLKRLAAAEALPGRYLPKEAVAPAIWGAPPPGGGPDPGAVAAMAARQRSIFASKLARAPAPGRGRRVPDTELEAIYRQPWMSLSPPDSRRRSAAAARRGLKEAKWHQGTTAEAGTVGIVAPPPPPTLWHALEARGAERLGVAPGAGRCKSGVLAPTALLIFFFSMPP